MESTTPATTDPSSEVAKTKKKKAIGLINHDMLKLVARGSAIIAEILRLKDYIPESYSNPAEEKANKDIIIDLTYFKTGKSDQFEDKIKASVELSTKDEDFRENNIEIVENKPLARMLFANVEVGQEVPPELYQAVAEILAAVYRAQNRV